MLQANELRIGNIVSKKFVGKYPSSYFAWSYFGVSDFKGLEKFPENYNPEPLTEEWLIKFGFSGDIKNGFGQNGIDIDCITTEENFQFEYGIPTKKVGSVAWLILDLKYVHQLQNLYFSLTGTELTIKP